MSRTAAEALSSCICKWMVRTRTRLLRTSTASFAIRGHETHISAQKSLIGVALSTWRLSQTSASFIQVLGFQWASSVQMSFHLCTRISADESARTSPELQPYSCLPSAATKGEFVSDGAPAGLTLKAA